MNTKERLVKCYKLKLNFRVWEEDTPEGRIVSCCPYSAAGNGELFPRCNGLNEWGNPCSYAYPRQDHRP